MKKLNDFIQKLRDLGHVCELFELVHIKSINAVMYFYKIGNIKGTAVVMFLVPNSTAAFSYYIKEGLVTSDMDTALNTINIKVLEAQAEE